MNITCRQRIRLIVLLGATLVSTAWAEGDIRSKRVEFAKGSHSATINGSIKGFQVVDHLVRARRGQSANISMATRHGATYFNILAPGETEAALFNGSTHSNQYEGVLPADGEYRIRVYMMRSAARRNESARYRLEIVIAGGSTAQAPASIDAKVPGTDFHATGQVRCTMAAAQSPGSCDFGVKREGQGNAMVTVTRPDGRKRVIFFEKGRATGYDRSQADKGEFKANRQGDQTTVNIGGERYEIPDAVVSGG